MAGLRVLLCLGALLARQGSAGLRLLLNPSSANLSVGPNSEVLPGIHPDLEAVAIGEVHDNVTLHCGSVSGSRGLVTWYRNDSEPAFLVSSNSSLPPAAPRFSLEDAGALRIEALKLEDDGNYTCQEVLNETHWFPVQLRVASGPAYVEVNISATGTLPNGTLYAARGSQVDFNCCSAAQPPPEVEWWIQTQGIPEFLGKNLSANSFTLMLMSQNLQGNYTCSATNVLSGRQRKVTTELLVYWPPPSAPQCSVEVSSESTTLELACNWDGGYPDPTFLWTEEPGGTIMGNSKLQTLSPAQLSEGKKFKCVGNHILGPESGASCVVQISSPLLPMRTCFVGGNVTLTCEVSGANPPARIQWLRNLTQPAIQPSSHYIITQQGQSSSLTIHNCSQDLDEGFYYCRAENLVGVRAANIWLSVKEPLNIGGIVGTVVSLLLLGLAVVSGLMLYYSPAFWWKGGSTFRGQDMGDVMVLVDSEEEEEEEEEKEEEKEDVAEEVEQETNETEELPKGISKHGRIHRVTALVNGNLDHMGNGFQEFQDDSDGQQSGIVQEDDKPV